MLDLNAIYCGDCLEMMKQIDDSSIDLTITSPPYNVGKTYDVYNDNKDWHKYTDFMFTVLENLYRLIKIDGRLAINISHVVKGNNEQTKHFPLHDYLDILLRIGFNIREIISWFKATDENHFSGGSTAWGSWCSASNPHLRGQVEVIIVANKSTWKKESGSGVSDITAKEFKEWTKSAWFIHAETDRKHPAPFPIQLPYQLIKLYSFIDDLILDPFIGSGTTAIACIRTKRNYIGIEISENYCNIARERIRNELKQLRLDL